MNDQPSSEPAQDNADIAADPASEPEDLSSDFHGSLTITRQYVKDLSFENPNAPAIYGTFGDQGLDIKISVDLTARSLEQDTHEVVVGLNVVADHKDKTAFILEIQYGAEARFRKDLPDDLRERALMVQVPRNLFPFLRNIVANTTRDGGFPPLLLNPINFRRLHESRRESAPGVSDES